MDLATLQAQLPQLEVCCERLYKAQDPNERSNAEQCLRPFTTSTEFTPHLRTILDNSDNPYAQCFASSSLLTVITEQAVRADVKLDIRNYFFNYLDRKGPDLLKHDFVLNPMLRLVSRITKLCWFDHDQHRRIVSDCKAFFQKNTPGHYCIGLMLLKAVVQEIHTPLPGRNAMQHRKTAVSFRDLALLDIFTSALAALRDQRASSDTMIQKQSLQLAVTCLSFDFVGTAVEDGADDVATLQIPSQWRPIFEDLSTMRLFHEYYRSTGPPLSTAALECLVRCTSVRRSLFSSDEIRTSFLSSIINITLDILTTREGLSVQANYHELCRLLGRVRNNYQLAEIMAVDNYTPWLEAVAAFTIGSLQEWQWSASSVHYLLLLWTRLVSSAAYLKSEESNLLAEVMPKIIMAFVQSRLESVQRVVAQDPTVEDPMENEEQLQEQLESLPYLCRFQYERMTTYLCSVLDPLLQQYQQVSSVGLTFNASSLMVLEGQLTWFVYMIGAIIKGRLIMGSTDAQEVLDGELAARALSLLDMADAPFHKVRYGEESRQRLDVALLHFFQHFRKVYVGEAVMHNSKIYEKLKEIVGIENYMSLLQVILRKVVQNLKTFGSSEKVIGMTLALLKDLSTGYMSGKLLSKLDASSFILSSQNPSCYSFLQNTVNARNRTLFYVTLARMIFAEDSVAKFSALTAPLQRVFEALSQASNGGTSAMHLKATVPADTVAGLFRDLYGIAQGTSTRRAYLLFFDWLYENHFPIILACLEAWADTPLVVIPLLKFMVEFVSNKGQCMVFESSSPNGILLFREISKILVIYRTSILSRTKFMNVYSEKYKGISLALSMLSRALNGSYVNFGVFELYKDPALQASLDAALQLALSIPREDVVLYSKVGKAYFVFLEAMCHNHAPFLVSQPHDTFVTLIQCLNSGIVSIDVQVSSQCAMAVDNLASWLHKNLYPGTHKQHPATQSFLQHINASPSLLIDLLCSIFEIVLFDECFNQWSLSRPMLSLILVTNMTSDQGMANLKARLISTQPVEKQPFLESCLEKLMKDVDGSLDSKNRDRFTQNLSPVRHDLGPEIGCKLHRPVM
jgi:exportin-7